MRLFLVALLFAISYAQTDVDSMNTTESINRTQAEIFSSLLEDSNVTIPPQLTTAEILIPTLIDGSKDSRRMLQITRSIAPRERHWHEPAETEDDSDSISEYYDEVIVGLISVGVALSVCACMMLCMYIGHVQHTNDLKKYNRPRRRVCFCILQKQKPKRPLMQRRFDQYDREFHQPIIEPPHFPFTPDPDQENQSDSDEDNENYEPLERKRSPAQKRQPYIYGTSPYYPPPVQQFHTVPRNRINVGGDALVTDSEHISMEERSDRQLLVADSHDTQLQASAGLNEVTLHVEPSPHVEDHTLSVSEHEQEQRVSFKEPVETESNPTTSATVI